MKKVSLWRRLGTRYQIIIVCTLVVALVASVAAIIQAERAGRSSHGELPFVLIPPTPFPEAVLPEWEYDFEDFLFDSRPISLLTGLPVDEENLTRRPIAAVINNSLGALPQSGVAHADIIYEVLAEGTTTRLIGVFQTSVPEKIGPIRSARDYFVDFALNHDAFFVHHGGSPTGYERIRNLLGINAVDGMSFEGTVFWRDRSFPYWANTTARRALEHSSFTGRHELFEHIESKNIRDYFGGERYGFLFGGLTAASGRVHSNVSKVVIPFSTAASTIFELDDATGMYKVSHREGPWLDEITQSQVSVANVLIQHTGIRVVDNVGRRNVTTVGSGTGYLVRNGQAFSVVWEKSCHTSPTQWFFVDGNPVVLAPGRTWINVIQTYTEVEFASGIGEQYGI